MKKRFYRGFALATAVLLTLCCVQFPATATEPSSGPLMEEIPAPVDLTQKVQVIPESAVSENEYSSDYSAAKAVDGDLKTR